MRMVSWVKEEKHIDGLFLEQEIYWKQRSRIDWLSKGDKNTKIFYAKASSRKRKNKIQGILDENENWTEEEEDVERIFCNYFANLFTQMEELL